MYIFVKSFKGETPKLDVRHLSNESAQEAFNCHFYHGNLEGIKGIFAVSDMSSAVKSIYKYLGEHWFTWDTNVDAVGSPVANDPWQRVYYTGDGYPKVTNNMIFIGSNMPAVAYKLGIQAPETTIGAVVTEDAAGEADPNDFETRYYTHTFVSEQGEEGAPGEASDPVTIQYPFEGGTLVTLSLSPPNTNQSNITHRRIYRSATGGGVADYLFVAEVPISAHEFIDNVEGEHLGSSLESYDYEPPEEGLIGLTTMANGILVGFIGNTLCFSEAYLPYAWPKAYQQVTDASVVALIPTGNTLTVLTEAGPWLFSGVTPDAMSGRNLELNQACVSKRSAVLVNGWVMYASPDGLVALNGSGAKVTTSQMITREQWRSFKPETIIAFAQEGRYLAFYGDRHDKSFIFDPLTGDLRRFDIAASCGFNDLLNDTLYLVSGNELVQWESSETIKQYLWRSKEFTTPDSGFSSVKIMCDDISKIGFKLFGDNKIIADHDIGSLSNATFRLPSCRAYSWYFELQGTSAVKAVMITNTMHEMRSLLNEV